MFVVRWARGVRRPSEPDVRGRGRRLWQTRTSTAMAGRRICEPMGSGAGKLGRMANGQHKAARGAGRPRRRRSRPLPQPFARKRRRARPQRPAHRRPDAEARGSASIAASPRRGPTRSTRWCTSAGRAPSPTPTAASVFRMDGAEVPSSWSQLASDILISKYFRKAGSLHGDKDQGETSIRQVVHRLAHTISCGRVELFRHQGGRGHLRGRAGLPPCEPVRRLQLAGKWFNLGLWHEYGIAGSGGNWAWNAERRSPFVRRRRRTKGRNVPLCASSSR